MANGELRKNEFKGQLSWKFYDIPFCYVEKYLVNKKIW